MTMESPVAITIDGTVLSPRGAARVVRQGEKLTYAYDLGTYQMEVVYEMRPEWAFLSKWVRVSPKSPSAYRVERVDGLGLSFPKGEKVANAGGASAYLIGAQTGRGAKPGAVGFFAAQQNPFPVADLKSGLKLGYEPKMEWRTTYGPFETDRIVIGPTVATGSTVAMPTVGQWKYVENPDAALASSPQIDRGAYDAIRNCINAFVISPPKKSLKVHIPWCENDYQIDLAEPSGPPQYERIIDQAKAMGNDYVLFTPQNTNVSKRSDSNDAWAWESLLWLGYGPKIRKGQWDVRTGPIDPSVQHFLDYAKTRDVKLLTYIYPTLAWTQDPEWTDWARKEGLPLGGYVGADTGNRGFQNWFVNTVVAFCDRMGLAGVSFDHWWMAYDQKSATSRYAQWYGTRRILEELRKRRPEMIIDGRQQYQGFGPWTWLGGSYPHPSGNDEQPVSFRAFADLHTDRVSADHQRYASYSYTVRNFTPPVLNPGYLTHQTQRNGLKGFTTDAFRVKDWDLLGWKYSVLSSIGTAPHNSVVSYIPARDTEEYAAFSKEDRRWFADWLAWPDRYPKLIAKTRPILGQPMVGKVDGTSMIDGDHGFVFLFNPNYRTMPAKLTLDASIGLDAGAAYTISEIEPTARPLGHAGGEVWRRGETVEIEMAGTSAVVLRIDRAKSARVSAPKLLNAAGTVRLRNGDLVVEGVRGEMGARGTLFVALPKGVAVREALVNGVLVPISGSSGTARLDVTFAGEAFSPAQAAIGYEPGSRGTEAKGSFRIPGWIAGQLARRRAKWPVTYTADDLVAPWLGPDRLLLFVAIADANDKMAVGLKIDGKAYPLKKAYNSIYPETNDLPFIGFYADVATLAPDVEHTVEVMLPGDLAPGQFQGVYFDNVEPELTDKVAPGRG